MQNITDTALDQASVGRSLEEAVRLLAGELRAVRAEARRQRRRLRLMVVASGLLLATAGWSIIHSFSLAESQKSLQEPTLAMSPSDRANRREQLMAMLPPEKQRELESFEREVDWLNGYMQTWDEGKTGAVVAMMLFRMGQSMGTMPSMEQQMRTMSGQMGALPAIVAELAQINAKMHVITATMDSTMGRAGRMMPWMPFSP